MELIFLKVCLLHHSIGDIYIGDHHFPKSDTVLGLPPVDCT